MKLSLSDIRSSRASARPLRLVLYGNPGVGKSTFAAQAPAPVFLCGEDGASYLDVPAFPKPESWSDVLESVDLLAREEHAYKTLVIDTLDGLEPLCWAHVCKAGGKKDIEDFGYGKGYLAAVEEWRRLLVRLERLQATKGLHLVCLAHAVARDHKDPEHDAAWKRWEPKLNNKAVEEIVQWTDALLYATYETLARREGHKVKGLSTGERILHTAWTAAHNAKNRYGLPEQLPLDWGAFWLAFQGSQADPVRVRVECSALIDQLPAERQGAASQALGKAESLDALLKLRAHLQRAVSSSTTTNHAA